MAKLVVSAGVPAEKEQALPASTAVDSGVAADRSVTGEKVRAPMGKAHLYLDLEASLKLLREKVDSQTRRISEEALAHALGHADKNQIRFRQKVEALVRYQLVTQEGEILVLTEIAVDALYAIRDDRKQAAILRAFQSYDDFKTTCDECPPNTDIPIDRIRNFVKTRLGITNMADSFIRLFLVSAKMAGLYDGTLGSALPPSFRLRARGELLESAEAGVGQEGSLSFSGGKAEGFRVLDKSEALSELNMLGLGDKFKVLSVRVAERPTVESVLNRDGRPVITIASRMEISLDGDFMRVVPEILQCFAGGAPAK